MSFWDSVKKIAQPYADEEYDDYDDEMNEYANEEPATPRRRRSPFASAAASGNSASTAASAPAESSAAAAAPVSAPAASGGFSGQVLNMGTGKQEVVLFHAKSFDDAALAATELRSRKAIILNMENVDKSLTRRVVDFLSGAVYALDGSVKKVAMSTYLFCPQSMNVSGDLENLKADTESYI